MNKIAKFNIGDLVIHKRIRYRAIVVDVDPLFQASGHYNPQAPKHEFATRHPWYRLLVDDSSQITYVEETMLIADPNHHPINNPHLHDYFNENEGEGGYHNVNSKH
ncbi:heat shock protein HspQ [Legionella fallonii]|uniref:Heat shock protein HspQ n=1 Tax=Legionella fallonii LLAP-10 TaxID=1212491 RepID=A0A098GC12_9GAMM|nr:heat shock protein HspQ [Legionella fallonii]CEG59026.1 putative DNA-binding protein hemimethylated [Legionella fallonii LLAP-10]